MDYRTSHWVREFRAGVLSPAVVSGAAAMAGQPFGSSRSPAGLHSEAGMSRKPDGGEGTAWSSLHPAGPPLAKVFLTLGEALADALDGVR